MNTTPWQFHLPQASLRCGPFRASIDLTQPQRGLFDLVCGDRGNLSAQLLGIDLPSQQAGAAAILEGYVRGSDLVAAYRPTDDWPVHVDARWKATASSPDSTAALTVELVVSVRTDLLDSRPELAVTSVTASCETLSLVNAVEGRFEPLAPGSRSGEGRGCVLVRLPQAGISYVEMVHPADCHWDELEAFEESPGGPMRMAHRLFLDPLEKGVILRGRVRGVLLSREDDCRLAADCYREFAASEPSLGG